RANDSTGPANESGQTLTLDSITVAPSHGTATILVAPDVNAGKIRYTPAANYNGPDSFTYKVCDNGTTDGSPASLCDTAVVTITCAECNAARFAGADSARVAEDGAVAVDVRSNDSTGPANESGQTR